MICAAHIEWEPETLGQAVHQTRSPAIEAAKATSAAVVDPGYSAERDRGSEAVPDPDPLRRGEGGKTGRKEEKIEKNTHPQTSW